MEIGFPNHPREDVAKEIEWIGKNGFDFVDIFLEEDRAVPGTIDVDKVRGMLKKYGLGVVGHTAYYWPIGSPVRALREAVVAEAERYFSIFHKLGVGLVTIHSHWPGGLFSVEETMGFQAETLSSLVRNAGKYDISLMLEPAGAEKDSIDNISAILRKVPGLFFHLDIGHANLFGNSPEEFIRRFRKKLRHVHAHDNMGDMDLHLPIGTGTIDWEGTIRTLKKHYNGTITLEVYSRDKEYALISKRKLEDLWGKS
jgi:sugar phosphate isomerase/epimerase